VSSQFGTVCDQTEYNTDVHSLSLTADYDVSDDLDLYANIGFSDATAEWTDLNLTTPSYVTDVVVLNLYTFEGMNSMTEYSKLHYQQVDLQVGGTYMFTPALYASAMAQYQMFEDKDPYVYGDLDGSAYRGYLGMGYKF